MDFVGWVIGLVGLAYGVWTNHTSKVERQRLHSFLKGLKPDVEANNAPKVLEAIKDEMARLIPPSLPVQEM